MKKTIGIAAVALLVAVMAVSVFAVAGDSAKDGKTATSVFKVTGMTCGGCEVAVKTAVGRLDGVRSVQASHKAGNAVVTYDPAKVTPQKIAAAIKKLGYGAELRKPKTGKTEG